MLKFLIKPRILIKTEKNFEEKFGWKLVGIKNMTLKIELKNMMKVCMGKYDFENFNIKTCLTLRILTRSRMIGRFW